MGTAEDTCEISFLIGPTYTSPNFIKSSKLRIFYNDKIITVSDFETKKVKNTNCYISEFDSNDFTVNIADFSLWDTKEVIRSFTVGNKTKKQIEIRFEFAIETNLKIIKEKDRYTIFSTSGESTFFCWTQMSMTDWLDRGMEIYFTSEYEASLIDDDTESAKNKGRLVFSTTLCIEPLSCEETALIFAFKESVNEEIRQIAINEVREQFNKNIQNWEKWTANLDVGNIPEGKEKEIVLSSLIMIKSCQSYDGGFMACPFQYCFSYFRDSFGALTGLHKAGCAEEIRDFLIWADRIYQTIKDNFNSCAMGNLMLQNLESLRENLASESPSYFCLIAGYYYDLTNDEIFIRKIMPSLDIAIETQLEYIEKNNGQLRFNGDETERYVPRNDGDMYYFTPDFCQDDFALSSMLLFLAAARFYQKFSDNDRLRAGIHSVRQAIVEGYVRSDGLLQWQSGHEKRDYLITNYNMFPLWLEIDLPDNLSEKNTIGMLEYIRPSTGYLPISPGVVEGFTGHTMGILLSNLTKLRHPLSHQALGRLTGLCDGYGTFSEFYGPGGISNTHNMNIFSSGINVAALMDYYRENYKMKGTKQ
jgi:hypothetical protein